MIAGNVRPVVVPIVPYSIKALTIPLQLSQVMLEPQPQPSPAGATYSKLPTLPGIPSPLKPR